MTGTYTQVSSENYEEFMRELGVNWFTRNIGNNLYPVQRIWQDQGEIHIDTETSFRSTQTNFKLDQTWQETTAEARLSRVRACLSGVQARVSRVRKQLLQWMGGCSQRCRC